MSHGGRIVGPLVRPLLVQGLGRGLLTFLILAVVATYAHAQKRVVIESTPTCPECKLVLRKVATLHGTDSIALQRVTVIRDGKGGFIGGIETFANGAQQVRVGFWDSNGKLVRTMGRHGKGPGEFQSVSLVYRDPRDTLYISDNTHTYIVTSAGKEVRRLPWGGGNWVRYDPPTRTFVVQSPGEGRMYTSEGKLIRTIPVAPPDDQTNFRAGIIWGAVYNGRVWTARFDRYEVEERRVDSDEVTTYVRNAPWFQKWTQPLDGLHVRPTNPKLLGITADTLGQVWTLTWVADANWKANKVSPQYYETERFVDTMVEVLDSKTGRLVVSHRFNEAINGPSADGLWFTYRLDETDALVTDVWEIAIVR
jgi:hypothetical protein